MAAARLPCRGGDKNQERHGPPAHATYRSAAIRSTPTCPMDQERFFGDIPRAVDRGVSGSSLGHSSGDATPVHPTSSGRMHTGSPLRIPVTLRNRLPTCMPRLSMVNSRICKPEASHYRNRDLPSLLGNARSESGLRQQPDHGAPVCKCRLQQVEAGESRQKQPARVVKDAQGDARQDNYAGNGSQTSFNGHNRAPCFGYTGSDARAGNGLHSGDSALPSSGTIGAKWQARAVVPSALSGRTPSPCYLVCTRKRKSRGFPPPQGFGAFRIDTPLGPWDN